MSLTRDNEPDRPLQPGLYEHLVNEELHRALARIAEPALVVTSELDPEESHSAIAQYLENVFVSLLAMTRDGDSRERQRRLANRLIAAFSEEVGSSHVASMAIAEPLRRLLALRENAASEANRPDTPLARSALLTGTRLDPALGVQLRKELASADRVDVLCSFIKWSGLRLLIDDLRRLTSNFAPEGPRLRVLAAGRLPGGRA